jgi:autotransporter strand-loop-strand O-heptosyltransferase
MRKLLALDGLDQADISFNDGATVKIIGPVEDREYTVLFLVNNEVIYETKLKPNHWAKTKLKYYLEYQIIIKKDDIVLLNYHFNLHCQKVLINVRTKAVGDNVAWMAQIDKFQRKHGCELYCNMEMAYLFEPEYPNIQFNKPIAKEDLYATYRLGWYIKNNWRNYTPINAKTVALTQNPCDILGLDHKPLKPKLVIQHGDREFKPRYVCISTQSTLQAKYWNRCGAWEKVIDYLKDKGLTTICLDKHSRYGGKGQFNEIPKNCVDKSGNISLLERIPYFLHCEFFIGLGSGMSWLAWALNKPVILISGFSEPISEFDTPYRIINRDVCHGCWNDTAHAFDFSDWLCCPRKKDFECSREITEEMVYAQIDRILMESDAETSGSL